MLRKIGLCSIIISMPLLFSQNILAKNLGNYVFPPLEEMETSAEQKYLPNTYMSYNNRDNSSFFQQSDYVFPEIEKPVKIKSEFPALTNKNYSQKPASKYGSYKKSYNKPYDYELDSYDTRKNSRNRNTSLFNRIYDEPEYQDRYSSAINQDNLNYYVSPSMRKQYSYPRLSSQYSNKYSKKKSLNNEFFGMESWNPMTGNFPVLPGVGKKFPGMGKNSSMFSPSGFSPSGFGRSGFMPNFF